MNANIYEEKKKFNVIDALIVFLLLALIIVVIFRAQLISLFNDTGKRNDVEITFVCEAIPNEILPSITSGSQLRWIEADATVGTLTIEGAPSSALEYYRDDSNTLRVRELAGNSAFKGKINGNAISSNGCYINGTDFLASGMTITLSNGKAQFVALITSVEFK